MSEACKRLFNFRRDKAIANFKKKHKKPQAVTIETKAEPVIEVKDGYEAEKAELLEQLNNKVKLFKEKYAARNTGKPKRKIDLILKDFAKLAENPEGIEKALEKYFSKPIIFYSRVGGKSKMVNSRIMPLLIEAGKDIDVKEYREPFLGGGSVMVAYLKQLPQDKQINVWINDKAIGISCVWNSLIDCEMDFIEKLVDCEPSKEMFYKYQKELRRIKEYPKTFEDMHTLAVKQLVISKMSYSGYAESGGIVGGDDDTTGKAYKRFTTREMLQKIVSLRYLLYKHNMHRNGCTNIDFEEMIRAPGEDVLMYLDPPYLLKGVKCYKHYFKINKQVNDHMRLCETLKESPHRWVLSYDDHPFIRKLYIGWCDIRSFKVKYGSSENKNERKELLITPLNQGNRIMKTSIVKPESLSLPSETDKKQFERLDGIIHKHLANFLLVGYALWYVKEHGLFKVGGFDSFEDYAKDRYKIARQTAYTYIHAWQVNRAIYEDVQDIDALKYDDEKLIETITRKGDYLPESQTRLLYNKDPEVIVKSYEKCLKKAEKAEGGLSPKLISDTLKKHAKKIDEISAYLDTLKKVSTLDIEKIMKFDGKKIEEIQVELEEAKKTIVYILSKLKKS